MKLIKEELKFLLFNEIYLRLDEPKAKRKALLLVEATVQCLARKGFDQVTMPMIAREAGVSRTLLTHYFKDIDELQTYALKYIRVIYQRLVMQAFQQKGGSDEMLLAHVQACLEWVEHMPSHAYVWMAFLQRCGREKKLRELNTEAVRAGVERLEALIQLGIVQGVFHTRDAKKTARAIQVLITGAVLSIGAETIVNKKNFVQLIQETCLSLATRAD